MLLLFLPQILRDRPKVEIELLGILLPRPPNFLNHGISVHG